MPSPPASTAQSHVATLQKLFSSVSVLGFSRSGFCIIAALNCLAASIVETAHLRNLSWDIKIFVMETKKARSDIFQRRFYCPINSSQQLKACYLPASSAQFLCNWQLMDDPGTGCNLWNTLKLHKLCDFISFRLASPRGNVLHNLETSGKRKHSLLRPRRIQLRKLCVVKQLKNQFCRDLATVK